MNQQLVWASVNNPTNQSNFRSYELVTVREYNDYCGGTYVDTIMNSTDYLANNQHAVDDVFYQIIGHYRQDYIMTPRIIGTYYSAKTAIRILQDITGAEVEIHFF